MKQTYIQALVLALLTMGGFCLSGCFSSPADPMASSGNTSHHQELYDY